MPPLPPSREADHPFNHNYHDYHFDPTMQQHTPEQLVPESATIDRDDELLSFHPTAQHFVLLDRSMQTLSLSLSARLHGMFFIADGPDTPAGFPQMMPPELTCYRRNLFQVSGSVTLPRNLHYILTPRGERVRIIGQELAISATESVEGGAVKLISVPWKTSINSPPIPPEDKTEKEPTVIPLDLMSNHDPNMEYATDPFAWKRLQFRIATANNGRRKELQQHFVARLKLVVTLSSGEKVAVAEARSPAIIVRGRSPRNFQKGKGQAAGERPAGRKGTSLSTNLGRRTSSDPPRPSPTLKRERSSDNPFASFDLQGLPTAHDLNFYGDWPRPSGGSNSAPAFPTPTFKTPTLPSSKSASSASPPLKTRRVSHPHPDEPDTKRVRQGPSSSPRTSNATHPSPQPSYNVSPLPQTLPSTRRPSSTQSPPTVVPEAVTSGDYLCSYFPAVTQPWQPTFTTASMNSMYSTPYLPQDPITASVGGIPGVTNVLPHAVTK